MIDPDDLFLWGLSFACGIDGDTRDLCHRVIRVVHGIVNGLKVCRLGEIFGVEEHLYGGLEILAYGIEPNVLYEHPELVERQGEDWLKMLHGVGALMIQAHPYREASYITMPGPLPVEWIDGIEIFNVGNKDNANELAAEFAAQHPEFILTAGSDAHTVERACMSGISTDERIRNAAELAKVLKSGRYELIY